MSIHEQMVSELGVPVFTTDLHIPAYREGETGSWRIMRVELCLDRGYHSGLWAVRDMFALLRRNGEGAAWETWMSLSPREVESQELGIRHAFGETVIMGLGLGWCAVNVALNPAVNRVTVIERDPDVIELFRHSGALEGLPEAVVSKLEIIEADALEWRPRGPADFLHADIWRNLGEPEALNEVCRMQENTGAQGVYYWGQELGIYAAATEMAGGGERRDQGLVRRCVDESIELPLLVPTDIDYAAMIERVVRNREAGDPPGAERRG
jgi:hypothetical protein